MAWALLAAFCICLIVNLATGGKPWCGIVGVSAVIFFVIFVDRPLLENTFLNRLQRAFVWIGVLLAYIAIFITPAAALAVPLVLTADVIFISVLLLFSSFRKTKNTLRLSYVFFAAAAECVSLGMAIGLSFFAAYLLVGISMIFCVSVLTVYRKELKSELRWRIFGKDKQDDIREQE